MEIKDSDSEYAEHVDTDIVENFLQRYSSEFYVLDIFNLEM